MISKKSLGRYKSSYKTHTGYSSFDGEDQKKVEMFSRTLSPKTKYIDRLFCRSIYYIVSS